MYETILVPTDGSDHSIRAAEHALTLSRAFDATVHVVTVLDLRSAAGPFDAGGLDEATLDRLETAGEDAIASVESVVDERDDVRTEVLRGVPSDAILEYASESDVDLLAMGTQGRTGLDRYIAGSVTERVVRRSEVPVLTVRADEGPFDSGGYDEILVPTDGSERAAVAVAHGIAIADRFDARIHAVNVVDIGEIAATGDFRPPTDVLDRCQERGEAATDRILTSARERDVEGIAAVTEGFPAEELLRYCEDNDIDLITMGTAGRTGLDRFLLGSTTERLIRRADRPVIAVPDDGHPQE